MNNNQTQLKEVVMFTDGSCLDNGRNGTGGILCITTDT